MPRLLTRPPKLTKHKASGLAVVHLGGKTVYLSAPNGTVACRREYDAIVAEWLAGGRAAPADPAFLPSVAEVVERFLDHADAYYVRADGTPSGEAENFRRDLGPVVKLYALTPAAEFGPLQLRAVREEMLQRDWARTVVNRAVGRVRQLFRWAVSHAIVPATVHTALATVEPLRRGRTGAREPEPVRPVSPEVVEATLPHLPAPVAAMVRLQMLTGMRSGEVCAMNGADLDTRDELWTYTPRSHKTAHHGRPRVVVLGPKAQEVIRPFLRADLRAPLFTPRAAVEGMRAIRRAARSTPDGQGNGPGDNVVRRRKRRRAPRDRYDTHGYGRAVARGCDLAFMPAALRPEPKKHYTRSERRRMAAARAAWVKANKAHRWHPHQLRHLVATAVRRDFGIEAARAVLGHARIGMTEHYAELDAGRSAEVMARIG